MSEEKRQDTINKVMQKAIDNGFSFDTIFRKLDVTFSHVTNGFGGILLQAPSYDKETTVNIPSSIWTLLWGRNHDFAKALWGEEAVAFGHDAVIVHGIEAERVCTSEITFPAWKHHLMHLVIAENRIEYLRLNALP